MKPTGPFQIHKGQGKKKLQKRYSRDFTDQDIAHSSNIIRDHFLQV